MGFICPLCHVNGIIPGSHCCRQLSAKREANAKLDFKHTPRLLDFYNGTSHHLEYIAGWSGIDPRILRKYDAAMEQWARYHGDSPDWEQYKKAYTVDDIKALSDVEHICNVNEIYKDCIDFFPYNRTVGEMVDPGPDNKKSSMSQPEVPYFARFGICFRCDKRPPTAVMQTGFKPGYSLDDIPEYILGTILQHCTTGGKNIEQSVGFWVSNRDVVSQTSICVARQIRGCGKFPNPQDVGKHFIYAFKFSAQKKGFDTEARQIKTGGRWLPGEKAFPLIVTSEILGWTRVTKLGSDTGSNAFNYYVYSLDTAEWEFTQFATKPDKDYLDSELDALWKSGVGGLIKVDRTEDFVAGQ
jgi:hypothetical protein